MEFSFVPTNAPSDGTSGLTLEQIPEDIRKDAEEVYAYLKTNPNGRMRTPAFADKSAALQWQALTVAYCKLRPGGEIRFRRSPTRNLPDNVIDFRITDVPAESNGTNAIRAAAAAVPMAPAKAVRK